MNVLDAMATGVMTGLSLATWLFGYGAPINGRKSMGLPRDATLLIEVITCT